MQQIPTGTVSFLFTDVVGSTRLWDQAPEAMRAALADHDHALRTAIEGHGGYVFSTAGDGFAAAFSRPQQAVEAAVSAQWALSVDNVGAERLQLAVRMAVHTGAAEERDGDYFGSALNRAARLMSMAHGGQVLITSVVAGLLREQPLPTVELRDLGEHVLRGLQHPERVFEVRYPGLVASYPPLRAASGRGNIPQPRTSFVGRVQELKALSAALAPRTLVTLTGPGGVGKTRLSLEAAWAARDKFPGGAWIVELASLTQPVAVVHAVANAVGARVQDTTELIDAIIESLGATEALLVLDNCEHVLAAASGVTSRLLAGAPGLALLATSREPLSVRGEQVWHVQALDPELEGVELFGERAVAADAGYDVGEDRDTVAQLCRRLDGIPLAIELAAARVRSMTPADLVARLDDRFRLLRGTRDVDSRHLTLRATVEWSYHLLDQTERDLFDQLAVFAGTFDLHAVEAVCVGEDDDPLDAIEALSALVDKSLVETTRRGPTIRYRLLETLRQYGEDRLGHSNRGELARQRHLRHFALVAETARTDFEGTDWARGAERIDGEWDNLRAAVATAVTTGDAHAAGRLVDAVCWYAHHHLRDELGEWARRAAAMPDASPLAFGAAAVMAMLAGDYEGAVAFGDAGCARAAAPTASTTLQCWMGSACGRYFGGVVHDAYERVQQFVAAAEARGDPFNLASALATQGLFSVAVEPGAVADLARGARRVAAPLCNRSLDAWVDCLLGPAEFSIGDRDDAVAAWRRARAAGAEASPFIEAVAIMSLATFTEAMSDTSPEAAYRDAISRLANLRAWPHLWIAVESLTAYWADTGRFEQAATVVGYLDRHGRRAVNMTRRRARTEARLATVPGADVWQREGSVLHREALLAYIESQLAGPAPSD